MSYITNQKCKCCNENLTLDCLRYDIGMCYKCVAIAHSAYEERHGGQSFQNFKRRKIPAELREYILDRDGNCLSCGSSENLTIDHITPLSKGGDNSHDNLQLLCRNCNSKKSTSECDFREVVEV